jgi:hypothetical protein
MSALLGASALGLVWGWWLAPWLDARTPRTWLAAATSSVLLAMECAAFAGTSGGVSFGVGLIVGVLIHASFRAELRARTANAT